MDGKAHTKDLTGVTETEWLERNGGPAHPITMLLSGGGAAEFSGMTLRDWFAGQALAACTIAGDATSDAAVGLAWRTADKMLARRP